MVQRIATHYEILGVAPDASTEALRQAYRRAAREHHPDAGGTATATSNPMAALNEAWRVLGDADRRARYDAELARSRAPGSADIGGGSGFARPVEPWHPGPAGPPARYPWRLVAGMAAVGIAIVIAGVVLYHPSPEAPPDNLLRAGSCVVLERNGDAREVNCSTDHDATVVVLVPFGTPCPDRAEPHRDRQGLGTACVTVGPPGAEP